MNKVQCLSCGMILESVTVHDFQQCDCANETFTDGGEEYQRYGGKSLKMIKVLKE
jgi:hypothetical protein